MIKGIIFDYGGVIGNDPSNNIYQAVSDEFGKTVDKIKEEFFKFIFKLEKGEIPEMVFWKEIAKKLDISDHEKLRKTWLGEFRMAAKMDKNIVLLLKKLKNHYKLCLLSNNAVFYQTPEISKVLEEIFDVIIYSFDVNMRKPEEEIYLYTLKRINASPEECIIIDDGATKFSFPKKIGMEVIHFKSFPQLQKELIVKLENEKFII